MVNATRTIKLTGRCHCNRVKFQIFLPKMMDHIRVCDCSVCSKRGALIYRIESHQLKLLTSWTQLKMYRWGRRTATDFFCKHCGVLPFRVPGKPTKKELAQGVKPFLGWSINVRCLDTVDFNKLPIKLIHGSQL